MKNKALTFSVLMSVYKKDNPDHLKLALESIYEKQTKKPNEIVIVFDGPLTDELIEVLYKFKKNKEGIVKYYPQDKNMGLGEALRIGAQKCNCDYIFRMDSDDISIPERFKIQADYLAEHPEIDVLGGNIAEFINDPDETNKRVRSCPQKLDGIIKMCKKRNPMNHMTVCIKKESLLRVGGYQPLRYLEDYYLWVRMIANECILENIDMVFVYARTGNGFAQRRGAKQQIRGWKVINKYMLKNKLITRKESIINTACRDIFILIPNDFKTVIYSNFLRERK